MQFWAAKLSAFDVLKAITCWMIFFHDFIAHTTTFTVGKNSYFLTSGITYTAKPPKIILQEIAKLPQKSHSKISKLRNKNMYLEKNFQKSNDFWTSEKTSYVAHCVMCIP